MAKTKKGKNDVKSGITGMLKEGLEGSRRSLSRIEAEGERLLKRILDLSDRYIPESQRKAVEDLAQDLRRLFNQLNQAVEENTKRMIERLNIPTRKDLEEYNKRVRLLIEESVRTRLEKLKVPTKVDLDEMGKQLRKGLDEQIKKALSRLDIATGKELAGLRKEVARLRKDLDKLSKKPASQKKKTSSKKSSKS